MDLPCHMLMYHRSEGVKLFSKNKCMIDKYFPVSETTSLKETMSDPSALKKGAITSATYDTALQVIFFFFFF